MLDYSSVAQLADEAQFRGQSIGRLVLEDQARQMGKTPETLMAVMDSQLQVMEQAAKQGERQDIRSQSGLTGGDGWRMARYAQKASPLGGAFCAQAMATHGGQLRHFAGGGFNHDGSTGFQPGAGMPGVDDGWRHWHGHRPASQYQRCGRRVPGGVRQRGCHGRRRIGGNAGRHAANGVPCSGNGH